MESSHQVDRELIVRTARRLLRPRVLFRPYGRDPKYGLDCIGVVEWVGKQCGVLPDDLTIPPYAYPPQREAFALFEEHMDQCDGSGTRCGGDSCNYGWRTTAHRHRGLG